MPVLERPLQPAGSGDAACAPGPAESFTLRIWSGSSARSRRVGLNWDRCARRSDAASGCGDHFSVEPCVVLLELSVTSTVLDAPVEMVACWLPAERECSCCFA